MIPIINSITSVNLNLGWYNQAKYCYEKTIHVSRCSDQLCSNLWTSSFWLLFASLFVDCFNPRMCQGDGWLPHPLRFILSFFLHTKTSAADVVSSCLFIPRKHFETSLVMVSYYGNEM